MKRIIVLVSLVTSGAACDEVITASDLPAPPPTADAGSPQERAREKAKADFTDRVTKMLTASAAGRDTTTGLAAYIALHKRNGNELKSTTPMVIVLEFGTVDFKGRRLPAGVFEANWATVNREAGEKDWLCFTQAAAFDAEFDMWRSMKTAGCQASERARLLKSWHEEADFKMAGAPAAASAAPPTASAALSQ